MVDRTVQLSVLLGQRQGAMPQEVEPRPRSHGPTPGRGRSLGIPAPPPAGRLQEHQAARECPLQHRLRIAAALKRAGPLQHLAKQRQPELTIGTHALTLTPASNPPPAGSVGLALAMDAARRPRTPLAVDATRRPRMPLALGCHPRHPDAPSLSS